MAQFLLIDLTMIFWHFAQGDMNHALPQAKSLATDIVSAQQAAYGQLCTVPQIQAREATVRALSEVNRALSKKVIFIHFHVIIVKHRFCRAHISLTI